MALDFNEALYLRENPDVCEAVMQGKFSSGLAHYHVFGRWEGRPGAPQIANLEKEVSFGNALPPPTLRRRVHGSDDSRSFEVIGRGVAAEYVARAPKDGYTLFLSTLSIVTSQIINPDPAFDLEKDFAPISLLASGAVVLVVSPQSNLSSVADIIALAKSKPDQVLCANAGIGSLPHMAAELFAQRAGIKLVHVPYPGSPQAVTDLVAGRVTMFFSPASTVIGEITAGKLKALATAANKRASVLPEVPSMAEAGVPDFDTSLWFGVMAPAGTPQAAIQKIASAAEQAMHRPDAVETLKKQGFDPLGEGPDAFGHYLRNEITRWSEVARHAGVRS
jgi:tripartite-type tricarboxylate transporter receptor subunit TctC